MYNLLWAYPLIGIFLLFRKYKKGPKRKRFKYSNSGIDGMTIVKGILFWPLFLGDLW